MKHGGLISFKTIPDSVLKIDKNVIFFHTKRNGVNRSVWEEWLLWM